MGLGVLLGLAPGAALGVGRFAYALVLPAMQAALNLSYAQAGVLGSANTAGYLLGALISHRLLYLSGYRRGLFFALLLQAIALFGLSLTDNLYLLLLLRLVQGIMGAFVFVGGASLLLASGGRGVAMGIYFGGVGSGILLSPFVLPFAQSWQHAWALLAGLSFLISIPAVLVFRQLPEPAPRVLGKEGSLRPIAPLVLAYGLYGAGYIGYMTFVTTGLIVTMELFWIVLGVGAILTGVVWGAWLERVGGTRGMVHVLLVLTVASLPPLVLYAPWLSAFAFGLSFLGVVTAITLAFSLLLPPGAWARAMGLSTAAFALGQAVGPSISGIMGDLWGGAQGALWASTVLLAIALGIAWLERLRLARHGLGMDT